MAKKKVSKKSSNSDKPSETVAIIGLILNIIILPGLGSVIGGKTREGIWQLSLTIGGVLIGLLLTILLGVLTGIGAVLGVFVMIVCGLIGWVWGIITGIEMIKESQ